MKSSSAIIACSTLLAGGAASTASSESAATAAAMSRSASQNSSSSRRTERLRNRHNVYKSTLGSTNRASRRLGIFLPIPSPTPSTINNSTTTTNTTTTETSSPTAAATRPSGIFGVGGTPSTSTSASSSSPSSSPSESPSDSTTVSDTPAPYYFPFGNDAPYTFGFDLCLSMMSMSVAPSTSPSESPSSVPSSTGTTIPPSVMGSPTEFSLSVDYDDPFNFDVFGSLSSSMSMALSVAPSGAPSGVPTSTMGPSGVSPPPTAAAATLPVVKTQCEFCNEVSMDESIIIPFSNETTCGMAKEIVIQLNSTSEDCELARKAEAICCPKPATLNFTSAPTISWQPTEAPVPRPESNKSSSSVITTTTALTMGVVISSCLVASWIAIGLP